MRIVVDSDIWGGSSLFSQMGDVLLRPGREIDAGDLEHADALIIRSITRVDEKLLGASPVRFVGTATTGVDHIDIEYLNQRGIAFSTAAGCNARPVVEYVLACLFEWRRRTGRSFSESVLGVVGFGRIGKGVAEWGAALGMRVLSVDPPLAKIGVECLVSLDDAMAEADVLTLHVPLTVEGRDATQRLIGARRLERIKHGAWLINAARGGVVVETDVANAHAAGQLGGVILDAWTGEPVADAELLKTANLLTPHIAGYSEGAHRRAALQIAVALCLCVDGRMPEGVELPRPAAGRPSRLPIGKLTEADLTVLEEDVRKVCDVVAIDLAFRRQLQTGLPAAAFDAIRAECRKRLELSDLDCSDDRHSPALQAVMKSWIDRV